MGLLKRMLFISHFTPHAEVAKINNGFNTNKTKQPWLLHFYYNKTMVHFRKGECACVCYDISYIGTKCPHRDSRPVNVDLVRKQASL